MARNEEPWPIELTNYLLGVEYGALDQEYYAPFNALLNNVFPFAEHFAVAPQTYPNPREPGDYLIELLLLANDNVVGGVQIKRESDIDQEIERRAAHKQVLDRFRTMHHLIHVPAVVMVSAFGRYCRVYRHTLATRTAVPAMTASIERDQWDIDLSRPQGRHQLNAAFNEIKAHARAIIQA
ncbi:hypothetical protein BGX27_010872 [Mortierella sp. AM989]|nr:hypothetical protein BGX27_010872 [Mortierella sp. AM989]